MNRWQLKAHTLGSLKGMRLESIKSSASQKFVLENRSDVKVKSVQVMG